MIGLQAVISRVRGIDASTLETWVAQEWVRPRREAGTPVFEEIDIARVQLIMELREELEVGDAAIPVVLSLLDQLHAARAEMRRVRDALETDEAARAVLRRVLG